MTFASKVVAGLATASAVLLLVAVLSYLSLVHNADDRLWVTHTYQVLEKLGDVRTNMTDAETGERGYILTGDDAYLAPYEGGRSHVRENLKDLRQLTADNAKQQQALDRLEPIVIARLGELRERIEVRRRQGLIPATAAVREGAGKEFMDQIRSLVAGMKEEEERLLAQRSMELEGSSHQTKIVIVIGEALAFLFLFAAGLVIQQEMRQRKYAEDEVRNLNTVLERKVAERTAELAERAQDLERS